jgi:hypothetical protein
MMFKELNEEKKQHILQVFLAKITITRKFLRVVINCSRMFAIRGLGTNAPQKSRDECNLNKNQPSLNVPKQLL